MDSRIARIFQQHQQDLERLPAKPDADSTFAQLLRLGIDFKDPEAVAASSVYRDMHADATTLLERAPHFHRQVSATEALERGYEWKV